MLKFKVKNQRVSFGFSISIALGATLLSFYSDYSVAKGSVIDSKQTRSFERAFSFADSIALAQKNDPWLTGSRHKQNVVIAMSTVAKSLPDPKISINLLNLPTDGLAFNQEGMTQFKVGIAQVIPRGDSLALKSQQLKIKSQSFPFQRENRRDQVAVTVGQLWLNTYLVQQTIALIEKDRSLFLQLVDVAQAKYSATAGKTRQQDIIRAQLELTRLDDRLDKLEQKKQAYQGRLSQWLINSVVSERVSAITTVSKQLPKLELLEKNLLTSNNFLQVNKLVSYFNQHPAVLALDKKIAATKTGIDLAKQKYKPQWMVNGAYSYRADTPNGGSRADFMSVGVTFDLPLFTENRQDKQVSAAISKTEAIKTEKLLLLRKFIGAFNRDKGRLLRLEDRQKLYKSALLPQMYEQAEASLNAYTNDDGDFAEVVRARIAVLNAEIEQLNLNVEQQKINVTLNYLFAGTIDNKTARTFAE